MRSLYLPALTLAVFAAPAAANPPLAAKHQPYPFKRVVVVSVGINAYPKLLGAADLKCAERDAEEFAKLTESQFGYETVLLLGSRGEATKANVERTLKRMGSELGAEDALVIYFAGHGQVVERPGFGDAGYLVPADADLDLNDKKAADRWAEQALDMRHLTDLMDGMAARHVLFIADACCSGFMARRGALEHWDLKTLLFQKSRTVFAATTRRQPAREGKDGRHGVFTAALLDQLRKDEAVSVFDLYPPVLRAVANGSNGTMTPQLGHLGDGDGMFVFIPKSVPRAEIEGDLDGRTLEDAPTAARGLRGVAARAREQQKQRTTFEQFMQAAMTYDTLGYPAGPARAREWEQRFERFRANAGAGDVWAVAALHYCYARGLGTERNPNLAYHWARQAEGYQKPAGVGQFLVGRCYDLGIGVSTLNPAVNRRKSNDLYVESARLGCPLGKWAAASKALGEKQPGEHAGAVKGWLEGAAAGGVTPAEVVIAECRFSGAAGYPADVEAAARLVRAAAGKDCPVAKYTLYRLLAAGLPGVPRDPIGAKAALLGAVASGYPEALLWLANEYLQEPNARPYLVLNLPQDQREARELVDRAAAQGHPTALNLSHKFYALGVGGPVNIKVAKERLEAATDHDLDWAYFELGNWYYTGKGGLVEQSHEKAFANFHRAAAKGHTPSCCMLGLMYEVGQGFQSDRKPGEVNHPHAHHALHWFAAAVRLDAQADPKQEGFHPDLFKRVRKNLQEFRSSLSTGANGLPAMSDPAGGPGQVAERWAKEFPDSFRYFCKEFGWRQVNAGKPGE